jgi:polyisoprenoid-binding protein YceI
MNSFLGLTPLAFAALVVAGCSNPTADKTAAKMSAPVQTTAPAAQAAPATPADAAPTSPAGRTYTFTNDDSGIDFTGYKVTGSHVGGFGKFAGTVAVPGDDLTKLQVDLTIDMNSTYSDAPDLTKTMKGDDFFEVAQFPTAAFTSTAITKTADGFDVTGNLTLHGVTKGITFPAKIEVNGDTLTAKAEFTIKRFEWNVNYKGMADDLIREDVLLYFDIVAKAKPAA